METDNTEELINTTTRYNHYCQARSKKTGKKCSLYAPHEGKHLPNHGIDKDLFGDDE